MKTKQISDLKGKALSQETSSKIVGGNSIIIGDIAVI